MPNDFYEDSEPIFIPEKLPPSPIPLPVSALVNQQQFVIQAHHQLSSATIEAPNSGTLSFGSSQAGLQQTQRGYTSLNKILNPQQYPQQQQIYQNQALPMEQRTQQVQQQMQLQQQYQQQQQQQQQRLISGGIFFLLKIFFCFWFMLIINNLFLRYGTFTYVW